MGTPTGRFAPSPTGPLHFGSLVAALGSYLSVRQRGGNWIVRIDDIDPPREAPGAVDAILGTLEAFGFEWQHTSYQSQRSERYLAALEQLDAEGLLYGCTCTRKQIAAVAPRTHFGPVYAGTCRGSPLRGGIVWRIRASGQVEFTDAMLGAQRIDLAAASGDFIVRRRGGLFAYHLACAVDDGEGIDEVVRGADLLHGTALQHFLRNMLGLPNPAYAHLPVAVGENGVKLSKQTGASPLNPDEPLAQLQKAWAFLGQSGFGAETPGEFWAQAMRQWTVERVPRGAPG